MKPGAGQLAAAILAATLAGSALAQQAAPPATTASPDAAAAQVSDQQLKNFASAQQKVEEIRAKYVEEAQSEQNPEKLAEVQAEMQKEMVEAVEDNELDVTTYNRIAQLLPQSNALQQRLQQTH
jgi:hypothetical protein